MRIVIDASVVVAALVDTGKSGIWSEEMVANNELIAPELLLIECTNVLRRLERFGDISVPQASAAQLDLLLLNVQLLPFFPLADRVWELRHNLSSYDATYVAVAEAMGIPLATLDRKMASQSTNCEFLTPVI
jgi:predicted nucleic acid-binding protein